MSQQVVINIALEGGVIQSIELPPGVTAVVRDYDVEGADASDISLDEAGQECLTQVWGDAEETLIVSDLTTNALVEDLVAWTKTAEPALESIVVTAAPEDWDDKFEWRIT
jgi:hypothetical protein